MGIVTLKIKIFEIEKEMNIFVIDEQNFDYNFLIGLDCIKSFQLIQNENLEITQKQQKELKKNVNIPDFTGDITDNKHYLIDENNVKEVTVKDGFYMSGKCKVNFNEHIEVTNFNITVNHLDGQQQQEINELISKYSSLFAKDKYDVGLVKGYEAHIDLSVDTYCSKRPYRCSYEDKKEIEEQVSKLLQNKLIEESYSPFAAPVTLAYKKEEGKKCMHRLP